MEISLCDVTNVPIHVHFSTRLVLAKITHLRSPGVHNTKWMHNNYGNQKTM